MSFSMYLTNLRISYTVFVIKYIWKEVLSVNGLERVPVDLAVIVCL